MVLNWNKWAKYSFMKRYASLVPYLPEMRQFSNDTLWQMVDKYGYAIVKPAYGSRGRGVIQITSLKDNRYELHYENRKKIMKNKNQAYAYIRQIAGSSLYLVQWRVPRATVNGRPFDLRVVIQRHKNSGRWTVTGKLAKVTGKGYIVSNITRSKGNVLPVNVAIRRSSITRKHGVVDRVNRVALLSANTLGKRYTGHRIFGLDMGLDHKGHVWIIEANLAPSISHFLKLGNKTMIRRIRAYKKH
ncbi:YheC/YheD family protein [Paenibacillus elgii]|uniref:YheC/YheD family protein n=1 Tax=Paenibacillus elgii TaxID=189691 RepID=UPI000248DACE|nr:YheC/YheD family protein [Paenibacillus elgii]